MSRNVDISESRSIDMKEKTLKEDDGGMLV